MTRRGIAIFARHFHPSIGGVEASSRIMARTLAAMDQTVYVITGTELGDMRELEEGYQIVRTSSIRRIHSVLRRCDTLISRGGASRIAIPLGWLTGCRVVCFHEMATEPTERVALSTRFLLLMSTRHVGVTWAVLENKLLPEGIPRGVLYNPVASDLVSDDIPDFSSRRYDLLYVGRVSRAKGLGDLVEALELLGHPVRLMVVGDGPQRVELQKRFEALPHVESCFAGFLQGRELRAAYRSARVLVHPPYIHREGMGMVVAEAMANGTPVVVSDQPPLLETMGHGGLAFKAGNSGEMARQINRLLLDRSVWDKCQVAALHEQRRFSMSIYRHDLARILDNLRGIHLE